MAELFRMQLLRAIRRFSRVFLSISVFELAGGGHFDHHQGEGGWNPLPDEG